MFLVLLLWSCYLTQAQNESSLLPDGSMDTMEERELVRSILDGNKTAVGIIQGRMPFPTRESNLLKTLLWQIDRQGERDKEDDEREEAIENNNFTDYFYEGDVLLNVGQAMSIAGEASENLVQARASISPLWDKTKPIYYTIANLDKTTTTNVKKAISFWMEQTCLTFVESPTETPRIRFIKGNGCWSYIGKQKWDSQDISLGTGCYSFSTAAHEIGHALGFYHTQSRPDRDTYVIINSDNIQKKAKGNFKKVTDRTGTAELVDFDFGSVMEYNAYAFSIHPRYPTVLARDWRFQATMSKQNPPSFGDIKAMNLAYRCSEVCPNSSTQCQNGGFVSSSKNCSCQCPPQFTGSSCSELNRGSLTDCNSQALYATSSWQGFTGNFSQDANSKKEGDCNWIIRAPEGRRVFFYLTNLTTLACSRACSAQALEINLKNFETTGMKFCCPYGLLGFQSESHLALLRGTATKGNASFKISYIAF